MTNKAVYGIFLTERSLLRLLIFLLLKRRVFILGAYSYLQNHGGLMQQLVNRLYAKHLVEKIDYEDDIFPYKDSGDFQRLTNVFGECEEWMEKEFTMHAFSGEYALACKHIISNRTYALYQKAYDIHYLSSILTLPPQDKADRSFLEYRFGITMRVNWLENIFKYIFNFCLLMGSLIQCLLWVFMHIRLSPKQQMFLGVDYNGGSRDMKFWEHLNADKTKTLVVVRDKHTLKEFRHLLGEHHTILDTEGAFDIGTAIKYWVRSVLDSFYLFIKYAYLPPDYYRQICFLPSKRIKYKALFNKYPCKFFWGRDDYNYQHILRSQEIRKIGGLSIGCNHGIQSIISVAFQLRYLDFDYYYMHGLGQYRTVYHKYWPSWMKARGVGSMFSNPEQHTVIRNTAGTDIAIIIAPSFHQDTIFETVISLAQAFPDLVFWISTKWKHRTGGTFGGKYQALIQMGLANVKESKEDVYDLLPRCKYLFSESSTLLAESVYFDRITLCYDPYPNVFRFLYYRRFPEVIFNDVQLLAGRIKDTIDKPVYYSDPSLDELIHKDSMHPWDIIKNDMQQEFSSMK